MEIEITYRKQKVWVDNRGTKWRWKEPAVSRAFGTGWMVWGQGENVFIVTNYHVIESYYITLQERSADTWEVGEWLVSDSKAILIRDRDGAVRSKILHVNREADIAVLSRSSVGIEGEPLELADPASITVGDAVTLLGYGAVEKRADWEAYLSTVYAAQRVGEISNIGQFEDNCHDCDVADWVEKLRHSAKSVSGDSGGPLVNVEGKVVGLNYAGGGDDTVAVHVSHLAEAIQKAYLSTFAPD